MNYKILTPTVTIFDSCGKIDYEGNKKIINLLIDSGIDGVLPLGSTGEFTHLSLQEKKDFFDFYHKVIDGRVEIFAGTGCLNFHECIELSNFALDLGAQGVMVISPYYYALDQRKIFAYYDKVAKNIQGNLYIYNFPARTGHSIEAGTMYNLCKENKNIKGIKDSVASFNHTKEILKKLKKDFPYLEVYSGFDDQFSSNMLNGGKGCIAALSNIVPEIWSDWIRSANEKNYQRFFEIAKVIELLMQLYTLDCNFSYLFKHLIKHKGLDINLSSDFPFEEIDTSILHTSIDILEGAMKLYKEIP